MSDDKPVQAQPPERPKAPYTTPQLQEFGSVAELTQGSHFGSMSDGKRRWSKGKGKKG